MSKSKNCFKLFSKDVSDILKISLIVCLLFTTVFLISIIYLPVVEKKLEYLSLINASLVTILVLINLAYTIFTYQIVTESKISRKIARAEKSLEKLYFPFRYFLKTNDFIEIGEYYYARSISSKSENVYKLEDIVPFLHLTSKKHKQSYVDFIDLLVQNKRISEIDISDFKEYLSEIKKNVEVDISELEDELNN